MINICLPEQIQIRERLSHITDSRNCSIEDQPNKIEQLQATCPHNVTLLFLSNNPKVFGCNCFAFALGLGSYSKYEKIIRSGDGKNFYTAPT